MDILAAAAAELSPTFWIFKPVAWLQVIQSMATTAWLYCLASSKTSNGVYVRLCKCRSEQSGLITISSPQGGWLNK